MSTTSSAPVPFVAHAPSVSLTVNDLTKSLAWYQDVVGFAIEEKYENEGKLMGVALSAGDARVMIGQDDGAKGWDRVKGQGFSLYLTTNQDVDEIANGIRERGGVLASEPADMPWGARVFRLQDPDGFMLAIASVAAD